MAVIYRPRHQWQGAPAGGPTRWKDCAAYALAMALDRTTLGGLVVTGRLVRELSDEPIPEKKSPGLNLGQLAAVAKLLRVPVTIKTGTWGTFINDLMANRGAVLPTDYDQFTGVWSCQKNFKEGHAVYCNHVSGDGDIFLLDPLCRVSREVPAAIVRDAAEKWARETDKKLAGGRFRYLVTRITPTVEAR